MANPQLSQQVTDHAKSVDAVANAGRTHRATLVDAVRTKVGAAAAGASATLVDTVIETMVAQRDAAAAADHALTLERADDAGLIAARDAAVERLFAAVVQARENVVALTSRANLQSMGVADDTPRDPMGLLRFAGVFVEGLRKSVAGPSSIPGVTFEPATFAGIIEPLIAPASEAIAAVAADFRENEAALVKRDRSFQSSVDTFRVTATLLSALLELAGEKELAARVRPSGRRPGTVADEPSQPAPVAA